MTDVGSCAQLGFAQFEVSEAVKHFRGVPTLPFPGETVSDDPNRQVITRYVPLGMRRTSFPAVSSRH